MQSTPRVLGTVMCRLLNRLLWPKPSSLTKSPARECQGGIAEFVKDSHGSELGRLEYASVLSHFAAEES